MKGIIYIAGSFLTVNKGSCGGGKGWIDNDPHFWTSPPTWGICRNDLRKKANSGDYVFFVLPAESKYPRCLFGYIKIKEKITHLQAYNRRNLRSKRMGNKNPNGNIIVNSKGNYNRYDGDVHLHMFNRIKLEYVIGDPKNSKLLSSKEIDKLAPGFMSLLNSIFGTRKDRPIDYISRHGRILDTKQVNQIIDWADS